MSNNENDEITHEDQIAISKHLNEIAKIIDKELISTCHKRVPFSLFTWGGKRSQYISNIERDTAMEAMSETLKRWIDEKELGLGEDGPVHKMN